MYARQSQCGLSWGYGTSPLAGAGRGARLPDRLSTPSDTVSDMLEQPQEDRASLRGRTPDLASRQEPSCTMERLPHAPCPASAPLRRVSGAGEALGCASFVCGEGGSTEIALLLWKSIRPLGTHLLRAVLLPHLYCGGRAVILTEEWHTVDAVLHLDWLLRGEAVRDQEHCLPSACGDKDIVAALGAHCRPGTIRELAREPLYAPEETPLEQLRRACLRRRIHLAVITAPQQSFAGIITREDLLEEFVGEIQDEQDSDEVPPMVREQDGSFAVDGRMTLDVAADMAINQNFPIDVCRPDSPVKPAIETAIQQLREARGKGR
jgi:hypothetical protein